MKNRPPKQAVIDAVEGFSKPFTIEDLFRQVREKKPGTSRATVYRTINHLVAEGQVRQTILPSGARLLLTPAMGTKALLYCRDCDSVECQADDQLAEKVHVLLQEAGLAADEPLCLSIHCGKTPARP